LPANIVVDPAVRPFCTTKLLFAIYVPSRFHIPQKLFHSLKSFGIIYQSCKSC
jgi:hypothetical protein